MSTYWQIAAGSAGRGYSKLFLKFGMAFFGSGANRYKEIKVGDTVILKQGGTKILVAGKVFQGDGEHRDKYPLNPEEGNGALDAIKWLLPNNLIQTT